MTNITKQLDNIDSPMLSQIEKMILNPELQSAKLETLIDFFERQSKKDTEIKFNQAFVDMMAKMKPIPRNGKSNRTNYATIDDIVNTTRPILSEFGFALSFESVTNLGEKSVSVTAILRHKLGHLIKTTHIGAFDRAGDNENQKARSTETYLKRYSATSLLGLSTGEEVENDGLASTVISSSQLKDLRSAMQENNVKEGIVLTFCNVENLSEITTKTLPIVLAKIANKQRTGRKQ